MLMFNILNRILAGSLFVGFCFFVPNALAAPLTVDEINQELVGRSIQWWEEGGWHQGHLTLEADGSAHITVDNPQISGDAGQWQIKGNQICTLWGKLRSQAEKCYSVQRDTPGRFVTSGGNIFQIVDVGV
jgi:hypothetical protein